MKLSTTLAVSTGILAGGLVAGFGGASLFHLHQHESVSDIASIQVPSYTTQTSERLKEWLPRMAADNRPGIRQLQSDIDASLGHIANLEQQQAGEGKRAQLYNRYIRELELKAQMTPDEIRVYEQQIFDAERRLGH